jgi:cell wall-associated NlpC family hydrolase
MKLLQYVLIGLSAILFFSCEAPKTAVAHKQQQPRFLKDIYLGGHQAKSSQDEAMDRATASAAHVSNVRPKSWVRKHSYDDVIEVGDGFQDSKLREKYAQTLGVQVEDVKNEALYTFIEKWTGTQYKMGGCDASGIDCSGFVMKLYAEVYKMDMVHSSYEQFKNCAHLNSIQEAVQGDLVFFKTRGKRISHVGVYLMNSYFVHSATSSGVMISNLNEPYYKKSFAGIGHMTISEPAQAQVN